MGHHWGRIPSVLCHITAVQNQQAWTLRLKLMTVVLRWQEEKMRSHRSYSWFMRSRLNRNTICGATRWRPQLSDPTQQSSGHNDTRKVWVWPVTIEPAPPPPAVASNPMFWNNCKRQWLLWVRQHGNQKATSYFGLVGALWLNYWLNCDFSFYTSLSKDY